MRRLADYWHENLEARGKKLESLDSTKRDKILQEIRGDFDLRETLRSRMARAAKELTSLTDEEYRVLDALSDNDRVVVYGGAGTGKTMLATDVATKIAASGRKVLFTCYSKPLARHLSESLPGVEVKDIYTFMATKIAEAGLTNHLPNASQADLETVFYPEFCSKALERLDQLEYYDAIIVDEGQDVLQRAILDTLDNAVKGGLSGGKWLFALDPHQDVHGRRSDHWKKLLGTYSPAVCKLTTNCRNTAQIATANQILTGLCNEQTLKAHGPDVEQAWVRDDSALRREVGRTLNKLLSEGIKPEDIVVLGTKRLNSGQLAQNLPPCPFPVTEVDWVGRSHIRYRTVPEYKGLESDAVLVVGVDSLEKGDYPLYVACSRPRTYLAIFFREDLRTRYDELASEWAANKL